MKIQKKIVMVVMLSISILFGLLTIQNEAVNETNQTNSRNNTTQTSSNNTTNNNKNTSNATIQNTNEAKNTANTNNTTITKSSNANLSNLGIKPHDFTGFKPGTIFYKAVIPENIDTIEVYAKTQEAKATVTGTGKKTLESGENKLEVVVTAEDGTKKTYTINITRGTQKESDENADGLSALKINDLDLSPEFKTSIYEYTAKYIGESTKLNIETIPTSEDYNIEIIGNEDLQEGENIITILVSEKNGDNVATYQITINKSLVDEEAMAREEAEKQAKQQRTIIGIVVAVVILIAIVVWIVVKRKNRNIAEEYSGVSLYAKNHNDEKEEKEEQELPKALKEEKVEEASDSQEEEKNNEEKLDEKEEKDNKEGLEYEEDEIENMPKEKVKEEFLDHYSNYEEEYDADSKEKKKKEKRKGKRFKE